MRYLEEHRIGFNTGVAKVPIVPAAILYDLNLGDKTFARMRRWATRPVSMLRTNRVVEGNVGAGERCEVWGNCLAPHLP